MSERLNPKYKLLQQFAENRERSFLVRVVPFAATATVELIPGVLIAGNTHVTAQLLAEHPELSIGLLIGSAALMGTGIAALIQREDITRVHSTNGKIAQLIGQAEGRNPQAPDEIRREIEHAKRIVRVASFISPTPGDLVEISFNQFLVRIQSRKHPEALEERAIEDRKLRRWSTQHIYKSETGYPENPQIITDALILAERRWAGLIEDETKPEYIRRYGALMRQEIQKQLTEHLTTPAYGEFERRRIRYESMSSAELGQELERFMYSFPQEWSIRGTDNVWEIRNSSPEKRILFEQIRHLISLSATTRGFQEVLLQELGYLYNRGLKSEAASKSELKSKLPDFSAIYDPQRCEEVERGLFKFTKNRFRVKWNPLYYDPFAVSNPVKRWLLNRREEAQEVIIVLGDLTFGRLLDTTFPLERSWKRQYQAKYKKKLKA